MQTKGEHEAAITRAIIQFEKDVLGRGPEDARTFFVSDMVLVRVRGIMTPAETKLSETAEGRELVKESRRHLFEISRNHLETIVADILDCRLISLHTDISTRTGERIIVMTLDINLDNRFN
jgi:uncharacterized protein YbcI